MKKKFKAIECEQNNTKFYLSSIDRDTLEKNCFVSRAEENLDEGFQRLLNGARANQIAKYLDLGEGVIPSALILSAQKQSKFTFDQSKGEIIFDSKHGNMLVLDGQHRLFGYVKSKINHNVPVVIFNNLEFAEEVRLFVDINTNQKGVSSSLLLDIKKFTGRENSLEERQRSLFDSIAKDSVLVGLVSPKSTSAGKISRKAFYDATKTIFEGGRFSNTEDIHIYAAVKNYLEACDNIFSEIDSKNATLTKTVVFKALFVIFLEVVELSVKKHKNMKVNSLEKELEPIAILNFDRYNGSSAAIINQIAADMRKEINKNNDLSIDFSKDLF